MKILIAATSGIYEPKYKETRKNHTGFGIMIRSIADMLTFEGDEVDIITNSVMTKGRDIGKAKLLRRRWIDLLLHTKPFYIKKAFAHFKEKDISFFYKMKILMAYMTGSYCEHLLKKGKYDVVHINGTGQFALPYMYACARTETPFVLTLHGLISFSSLVKAPQFAKRMEREFFSVTRDNENALATVISTGIKNRLCEVVGASLPQLRVVCNPVISSKEAGTPVYTKSEGEKVIVCVGNVSERKNQKLAVDAFNTISKDGNYKLFIIGGNETALKEYAEEKGVENVVFTGAVDKTVVNEYYKIADLFVTASLDEGFGLPIVEAYSYGVPTVIPKSIDSFPDLYAPECCVGALDYEIPTFASAMSEALSKEWDKELIKNFSKKFTEEICSAEYLSVLREAKKYGKSPLDVATVEKIKKASCPIGKEAL